MPFTDDPGGSTFQGWGEGGGVAAAAGRAVLRSVIKPEGKDAHGASHSSSETWSNGMERVLLARMLQMLVSERRLAMPIRLTPVLSRFT